MTVVPLKGKRGSESRAPREKGIEETPPPKLATLPEQIADAIKEQILKGTIAPGDNIPEQRLSTYFNVSRGPVREALRILEREGVVAVSPRRGAQVTKLTAKELVEIYQIRAELFALAAKLFARDPHEKLLTELRKRHRQMSILVDSGGTPGEHGALSTSLTQILCMGCGNQRLSEMLQLLGRQIERYTVISLSGEERRRESAKNWENLINMIADRNSALAGDLARRMVEQAIEHALPLLESI